MTGIRKNCGKILRKVTRGSAGVRCFLIRFGAEIAFSVFLVCAGWISTGSASPGDQVFGARVRALGNAGSAYPACPSSLFLNPAAAARSEAGGVEAEYTSLYGVGGAFDGCLAASMPVGRFGFGCGWRQRRLENLYRENRAAAVVSYRLFGETMIIGAGVSSIFTSLSSGTGFSSTPAPYFDFDGGLLFDFGRVRLGASCINAFGGEYSMLEEGGAPFPIRRVLTGGAAFEISGGSLGRVVLLADLRSEEGEKPAPSAGVEISLYDVLFGRVGISGENFSMGAGLHASRLHFEIAVTHHETLDDLYQFAVILPLGSAGKGSPSR